MRLLTIAALSALSASALAAPQPMQLNSEPAPLDDLKPYHPKILLLRHGEKAKDGSVGLNADGKARAECLRKVLGKKGKHRVGLIIAQDFNPETKRKKRPYDTVKPLAKDLGLEVDHECEVDDPKCVEKKVKKYVKAGGRGEIVICWKHSMLHEIAHELGSPRTAPYPDDRYDIIWTLHRNRIVTKESEQCPGLDKPRRKDPDLEVDPSLGTGWSDEDEEEEFDDEDGEEEEQVEAEEKSLDEEEKEYELFDYRSSAQLRLADVD
ncbi:hypothetical protein JCM10207_005347 [Rhodosporidiobolus poonsookiae]